MDTTGTDAKMAEVTLSERFLGQRSRQLENSLEALSLHTLSCVVAGVSP